MLIIEKAIICTSTGAVPLSEAMITFGRTIDLRLPYIYYPIELVRAANTSNSKSII